MEYFMFKSDVQKGPQVLHNVAMFILYNCGKEWDCFAVYIRKYVHTQYTHLTSGPCMSLTKTDSEKVFDTKVP